MDQQQNQNKREPYDEIEKKNSKLNIDNQRLINKNLCCQSLNKFCFLKIETPTKWHSHWCYCCNDVNGNWPMLAMRDRIYNRFAAKVDVLTNRYDTFVDEFSSILYRQAYALRSREKKAG